MAIGRISGSVLKSNLTRNGVDLAFETNLLYLDVTNARVGIGTSEPTTALDVSGTVNATAFTGDGSGLTGINVSTNIQLVGDDSTGAILGTGETFKIAGGNNITTAVSGDTLTVTGSKDINVNSITSDDSTAIQINDNINIAGNILPTTTLTYNLGSTDYRFNELWLAGTTIDLGGTKLSIDGSGDFEVKDSSGNRKNVVADSVFIGTGASKIKLSRGNNGKLKFTDENDSDTAILTVVGDDSTGVDLNSGETVKIAGAGGITTAVSGDTLTITGTAQDFAFGSLTGIPTTLSGYGITDAVATGSTAVTVVGDDSTGTGVNIGETFKIAGAGGVTTAVSGDTLTITGPTGTLSNIVEDTTPQLGGSLDVNGNSIVSTSNGNIVLDPDGTGVIEVKGSIVPNTDLTVSLGSPSKRFTDAYFGAGTVYIGNESISSSDAGLVFSAPISVEGGLTQISDDTTATVINATKIGNSATTVNSFDTTDYDSVLYYTTTLDESNNKIEVTKISLCHDTASSYMVQTGTVTSDTASVHTYSTDISGSVRLQLTGSSAVNSMTAYQLSLGNNSSAATSGHTAVVTPGTITGSSATAIDSWSTSVYRSVKYFISVKNTDTNEVNNIEAIVLHNGTDADITSYNIVKTGSEDLCDLSVGYSSGTVTLYATPNNSQTLRVMIHKISLADSESVVNYDNIYVLPTKTISGSSYTTIDTFEDTKINGAVYFVTSTNTTDGLYTASEVYVTTNGTESHIVHGPELAIGGQIYFTTSVSGNKVNLKAYTTGSSNTVINAYRIGMYRFEQGGDFAQTVTLDTAQTISGAKTFTAGVLTDTIQSPGSNADLTIDASGTGAVQILTQKVIMSNLPTSDPGVAGQLWNNSGVLNISAG